MSEAPRLRLDAAVDAAVEDAIGWMVNLNSDEATPAEYAAFHKWYDAHPAHRAAWDRLSKSIGPLKAVAKLSLPTGALTRRIMDGETSRRRLLKSAIGGAAAITSLAVLDRVYPLAVIFADHSTGTGRRETVVLDGGGTITLAPRTAINIRADARRDSIELLSGEVFVQAEGRHRALDLVMRDWVIHSVSGRIALHERPELFSVTALDQPVDIRISDRLTRRLGANQTLTLQDGALLQYPADAARETAWTNGLLVVKDRPLAEVVASIRPYYFGVIHVSDSAARVRVGGVFELQSPQKTFNALAQTLPISIQEVAPFWLSIDRA
jgi:transmembrane sensor